MLQIKEFLEYIINCVKCWVIIQPWETGIRVRVGKKIKKLTPGIHFKFPYFDSVYSQEARLRMIQMSIQTLTTKDFKTLTLNSALGYSINDIEKLYNTLYHPDGTISNICMSEISELVMNKNIEDINIRNIEDDVLNILKKLDYGINFEYFKITNFAVVRTFRLIQDSQSWVDNGLSLTDKK